MTKTIDTLIEDIYSVLDDGIDVLENNRVAFARTGEGIRLSILNMLLPELRNRSLKLRMSNLGKPLRQLWYQLKGYEGEPLPPHVRLKFLIGNIVEEVVVLLAALAGHEVKGQQDVLEITGVQGHRDVIIDGYTVDVKSTSPFGFTKFEDGSLVFDDPFGYIPQLAAYTRADKTVKQDAAYNLAVHKVLGTLALYRSEEDEWPDIPEKITQIRAALEIDTPPDRCYEPVPDGKSGNMKLGVGCSYCEFKRECWKDSNAGKGLRTFIYSVGPRFLTNVERLPNVYEAK